MMQKTLGIVGLSVTAMLLNGCGIQPPPFSPKAIEQIQREQAAGQLPPEMRALPTTLPAVVTPEGRPVEQVRPTTQPIGPTVSMSLREIIHRTVANSLDVRVAGYQAAVDEARILEAEARFDTTFFFSPQYQKQFQQRFPPTTQPNELINTSFQAGLRKQLESGGQIQIAEQLTRSEFQDQFVFPPGSQSLWDSNLVFQLTQPLARDFGSDVNRARITVARNDQRISVLEFRNELERTLQEVEQAYWQLVLAIEDVKIQEKLLEDTQNTLDIIIRRLPHDTSMVQVSQARASVEARNATLVRARAEIGDLSDRIKRLMNDPELPVSGPVTIVPADLPVEEPIRMNLLDQIDTAMRSRLELLQQLLRIDSAGVIVRAGKNNLLPQVNLVTQVGFQGLDEKLDVALDRQDDLDELISYTLGLQIEIPIGNREARAIYQRTLLQYQQAVDQYRLTAEQVALDVKLALRQVYTSWDEIIATRQARFAAEDALAAIVSRERAGERLTPEFVQLKLDRQTALAQTERSEVEAIARYNLALANLEKAKGTLLRYNNVVMKEEKGPMFYQVKAKTK